MSGLTHLHIARICHEVNRSYCEAIGDFSQVPWEEAPKWQKESAIQGVLAHIENPDMTPEMSHEAWMGVKAREGWVYGPRKDEEKKEHPCMVPYHALRADQQVKDHLFRSLVHAMVRELG